MGYRVACHSRLRLNVILMRTTPMERPAMDESERGVEGRDTGIIRHD